MTKYYAVRKGRRVGIFTDWGACKDLVSGFKGAEYKSFPTLEEADEYINKIVDTFPNTDDDSYFNMIPSINKPIILKESKIINQAIPNLKKFTSAPSNNVEEYVINENTFKNLSLNTNTINQNTTNKIITDESYQRGLPSFIKNMKINKVIQMPTQPTIEDFNDTDEEDDEEYSSGYKLPSFINTLIKTNTSYSESNDDFGPSCIYVDGGCNKQTKDTAFASVVDYQGNDLIGKYSHLLSDMELRDVILPVGRRIIAIAKFNDVKSQQNNGAELLALIIGYRIALVNEDIKIIYSDSNLIINYWSKRLTPSKESQMDARKVSYIKELIELRKTFEAKSEAKGIYHTLRKIAGDRNLSDLGYH